MHVFGAPIRELLSFRCESHPQPNKLPAGLPKHRRKLSWHLPQHRRRPCPSLHVQLCKYAKSAAMRKCKPSHLFVAAYPLQGDVRMCGPMSGGLSPSWPPCALPVPCALLGQASTTFHAPQTTAGTPNTGPPPSWSAWPPVPRGTSCSRRLAGASSQPSARAK